MNRSFLAVVVILSCALTTYSQRADTRASSQANSEAATSASKSDKTIEILSGTSVAGELQSTLDVSKAQVGDQVVLKTTKAIKTGSQNVVGKGAKLIGHVTEVSQKTKGNAVSRIGLVFDRIENGSLTLPISVTITSITSANANARAGDDDSFATDASVSANSGVRASSGSQSSGGLLGGVTNTTGSVLSTTATTAANVVSGTTAAVGSTVNTTTNVVGGTAAGVGTSLSRIQVSEASSTSAEGGAVLSLRGDNIRLEKGTNFNLVLNQSASAGTAKDQ